MTDTMQERSPRMGRLAPETYDTGMRVDQFDLGAAVPAGVPFEGSSFIIDAGGASPVDVHSVHEIWMIASGEGELRYDGQSLRIRAGDVFYFAPMKTHEVRNDGPGSMTIFSVWWPST